MHTPTLVYTGTLNTIDPKQAHDIRHALRSIQQNHPDPDLKRASGIVIDAVNRLELINFAVHPKGHGVVSKIRIPKGTVVGEYYGEVYPAWRWAEKQAEDEAKRAPGSLPDFWNIRLDRPREDRKGYDVLYVVFERMSSIILLTHSLISVQLEHQQQPTQIHRRKGQRKLGLESFTLV